MIASKPRFITGDVHGDRRGTISFINNFNLDEIKRFYVIEPACTEIIRAWQGHRMEQKWFFVVSGSFKVVAIKIDDWNNPPGDPELLEFNLNAQKPGILHLPGGYANGFKAMEANSKVMIFSDFTVPQSMADEYRFDQSRWYNWAAEPS